MAEQVRILQCLTCDTLTTMPYYDDLETDIRVLQEFVERHPKLPNGDDHRANLYVVEKKHWESPSTRKALVTQIEEKSGHTGLDPNFYDTKANFTEDALLCFAAHRRNPACPDYHADSKRIYPATGPERKELGLSVKDRPNRFLCDFCPVESYVKAAKNAIRLS